MSDPDGFEENAQAPLEVDDSDENVIDESIWGPQVKLTPEEQASYDAWFRRRVEQASESLSQLGEAGHSHEDVMAMMSAILEDRIAKASKRGD